MMLQMQQNSGLVPVSSSQAGGCLTFANWQSAGIQTLSFHMADLLMKPGLSVLQSLTHIRNYFNWPGEIIINAASLSQTTRDNQYLIHSPYDGSVIRIEGMVLFSLIARLKPDKIILPCGSDRYFSELTEMLPEGTVPYFHISEDCHEMTGKAGKYILPDPQKHFPRLLADINACAFPTYVMGNFDAQQLSELGKRQNCLVESDKPARDGMTGLAYERDGLINILDPNRVNEHWPVDDHCQCQTCASKLSRAYLHHLLQHTPLLAQRYLILHNVYFSFTKG